MTMMIRSVGSPVQFQRRIHFKGQQPQQAAIPDDEIRTFGKAWRDLIKEQVEDAARTNAESLSMALPEQDGVTVQQYQYWMAETDGDVRKLKDNAKQDGRFTYDATTDTVTDSEGRPMVFLTYQQMIDLLDKTELPSQP